MTTLSQLVDRLVIQEFRRPELSTMAIQFVNATIRDLHFKKDSRTAVLLGENRCEESFEPTEEPVVWPIPSPQRFQVLEAIYSSSRGIPFIPRTPETMRMVGTNPLARFSYYRSGPNYVLNQAVAGEQFAISYFMFPRRLVYYPNATRPAIWDDEAEEYVINESWAGTDEEAIALVSHWLLERHEDAIVEGVRAKLYRRIGSEMQGRMAWSEFESYRAALHSAEAR